MSERRQEVTGTIIVRRDDDGAEFSLSELSTFADGPTLWGAAEPETRSRDVVCPDGRPVYARGETFFFSDEPTRPMRFLRRE